LYHICSTRVTLCLSGDSTGFSEKDFVSKVFKVNNYFRLASPINAAECVEILIAISSRNE